MVGEAILWGVRAYSVAAFGALWFYVARADYQLQKISHRYLRYGLWAILLAYGILLAGSILGHQGLMRVFFHWDFYKAVLVHIALCSMAAMLLWTIRIWPAGDAKLFMLLGIIYPLINIFGSFKEERLFLIVLINTFLPASLFVAFKAAAYIFDTRLRQSREFFLKLGWRRELEFYWSRFREEAGKAAEAAQRSWDAWRAAGGHIRLAKGFVPALFQWFLGMLTMSIISYAFHDFFKSPILLSFLCMGLFMGWSWATQGLGPLLSKILMWGILALFLWRSQPLDWPRLLSTMTNVTVFSFFMMAGMNWATRMVTGGWSGLAAMLFPLLVPLIWTVCSQIAQRLYYALHQLSALPGSLSFGSAGLNVWLAELNKVMALAMLGVFFGLCLVVVRKWDEEVRPNHAAQGLSANLLLAPAFIARLKDDPDFFNQHFQSLYADGLTFDQAEALKAWCGRQGISMVPLAPTMSFAFWIFFGFFLSVVLKGGHVLQLLF